MFTKKDYLEYFHQILLVENSMEKKGEELLKFNWDEEDEKLLRIIVADEKRHEEIVKNYIKIIGEL